MFLAPAIIMQVSLSFGSLASVLPFLFFSRLRRMPNLLLKVGTVSTKQVL